MSVLVNGSLAKEFFLLKDLRQGDPLAPILFLITAKSLAGVLRKVVEKDLMESLEIGDKKVKVNMLQYVDDTLFFLQSDYQKHVQHKGYFQFF